MGTTVKGLLKGLRYISQIFDSDDKEQDMQIGFPTDVKHVAHIGCDGPSVAAPSWMNEFKSAPVSSTPAGDMTISGDAAPKRASDDLNNEGGKRDPATDFPLPKPSRRSGSNGGTGLESPIREPRRRYHSTGGMESPTHDPSEVSRQRRSKGGSSPSAINGCGSESPASDLSAIPKQARRKKTRGGSSGGCSKASRKKAIADDLDIDPLPTLKVVQDERF